MQLLDAGERTEWSRVRAHSAVLGLVAAVSLVTGLAHLQMPLPPHSAHDAFTLIPQLNKLLLGLAPDAPDFGMFEGTWFTAHASAEGTTGWSVWFYRVFSNVQSHTWIDAPHPMLLASLLALALPGTTWAPVVVLSGYLALLLVALYAIGTAVCSRRAGVTAAVIAAGCPALFGSVRYIEPHLPTAAMATAVVALLILSDGLSRWALCLLASFAAWSLGRTGEGSGEVVIAGLLVVGPALATMIGSRATEVRPWLLGLGCLVLPCLLLSDLSWMVAAMERVTRAFADPAVQTDVAAGGGILGSRFLWVGAYGVLVGTDYLRPALTGVLLLAGAGLSRSRFTHRWVLLSWLIVPLIALSWMQRKAAWYGIGLVPPLALFLALGLEGWGRRWMHGLAMGVALAQLVLFSLVPRSAFGDGVAAWLREPLPVEDWRLRRVDLLRPMGDASDAAVVAGLDQVLAWLDEAHPAGEDGMAVALLTLGNRHDYAARYYLELHRPDVTVVNLFDPRVRQAGYRNLHPDDFVALVFVEAGLHPWPPSDSEVSWLRENLHCTASDPLDPFLAGVLERGLEPAGFVGLYGLSGRVGGGFDGDRIWEGLQTRHLDLQTVLCGD